MVVYKVEISISAAEDIMRALMLVSPHAVIRRGSDGEYITVGQATHYLYRKIGGAKNVDVEVIWEKA